MNLFIGIGRLTADPEIRKGADGKEFATFTIAINMGRFAEYVDCITWDRLADLVSYARKDDTLGITGQYRREQWFDDESGISRSRVRIRVNHITFVDGRRDLEDEEE